MTYEEMCSFETLYEAYLTARKGKRNKVSTAQYEANALVCTAKLSAILSKKVYTPSKFEIFRVYEPKERLVQAPAFVDKVVLHAVVDNILYDAICKSFIRDNFASQKQKGTHDGLMRLKYHMVEYYRRNGSADGWVLKCDVRHFFASIDHDKLKAVLRRLFKRRGLDMQVYELLTDDDYKLYLHDESAGEDNSYDEPQTVRDIVELCKELNEEMLLDSYSEESPDYDDQLELRKDTLILETLLTKAERVIPPTVRRYNVVIVEHRKKLVPVLAASWAEAEERVREMWENGEVVIGQSDFTGIMISSGG